MAKYVEFKHKVDIDQDTLRKKVEAAPLENAAAILKAYELLDAAEKHGILDILRGAVHAEGTILDKVAGYANTPEGIRIMRNLLILGKAMGNVDPDLLGIGLKDLTATTARESKEKPVGLVALLRRFFRADVLRGLAIAIAALESIGRVARTESAGHAQVKQS